MRTGMSPAGPGMARSSSLAMVGARDGGRDAVGFARNRWLLLMERWRAQRRQLIDDEFGLRIESHLPTSGPCLGCGHGRSASGARQPGGRRASVRGIREHIERGQEFARSDELGRAVAAHEQHLAVGGDEVAGAGGVGGLDEGGGRLRSLRVRPSSTGASTRRERVRSSSSRASRAAAGARRVTQRAPTTRCASRRVAVEAMCSKQPSRQRSRMRAALPSRRARALTSRFVSTMARRGWGESAHRVTPSRSVRRVAAPVRRASARRRCRHRR